MSFQDFRSSGKTPSSSAPSSGGLAGTIASNVNSNSSLRQISEALLQYQRNVGILEKIVHSFTAGNLAFTNDELNLQYQAQVDVIGQLEDKVRRLINEANANSSKASSTTTTAVLKLQRDFERVQNRAKALQEGVTKFRKEMSQKAAAARGTHNNSFANEQEQAQQEALDYYEQMQAQLQQDRLNEEIMREREEEIRNINRGMHQVNEIYKDLAHIVGSQQEQIDSIETQMEDARTNAESGLEQVERANERYGSAQCTIS